MENLESEISIEQEENGYFQDLEKGLDVQSKKFLEFTLEKIGKNVFDYKPQIPHNSEFLTDSHFNLTTIFELKEANLLKEVLNTEIDTKRTVDEGNILIERLNNLFALAFPKGTDYSKIIENTREKFLNTPAVKSFHYAFKNINKETKNPDFVFVINQNLLETAVLLERLDVIQKRGINPSSAEEMYIDEIAKENIYEKFLENAKFNDAGEIERVEFNIFPNNSVKVIFEPINRFVDKKELLNTPLTTRILANKEVFSFEIGNGTNYITTENFIYRPTGQEFIKVLNTLGLKFHEDLEALIFNKRTDSFSDRYGGVYTQISRNLAKVIASGDLNQLNKIFQTNQNQNLALGDIEKLANVESTEKGFKVVQDILKQLVERKPEDLHQGIPALNEKISIQDGACFDVFSYYLQAKESNKIIHVNLHGKNFLSKTHGKETFINTEPVVFKGITLPKGCLFIKNEKDELAFLRFTPFLFEKREDMISTFGTEVLKAEVVSNNSI